jgi:hypothetical protein
VNVDEASEKRTYTHLLTGLRNYEARLRSLATELHGIFPGLPTEAATQGMGSVWLRELLCPVCVPVEAFTRPGNRLGVVEPMLLRRILALRTLYASRTEVRRCIDRSALASMRDAVGLNSLKELQTMDSADGESVSPLPRSLESFALVREGLRLFVIDGCVDDPGILRLMSLHFSDHSTVLDRKTNEVSQDGEMFLRRLNTLVPELIW